MIPLLLETVPTPKEFIDSTLGWSLPVFVESNGEILGNFISCVATFLNLADSCCMFSHV